MITRIVVDVALFLVEANAAMRAPTDTAQKNEELSS
jgi:hypothetical protein